MAKFPKVMLLLVLFIIEGTCHSALFFKTTVTATRFDAPNELQQQIVDITLLGALQKYLTCSWCTVLCEVSATSYILSDLLVSGGAQDNLPGDKLACFTKREVPGVFPSPTAVVADSSPIYGNAPLRSPSNLLNGIYGMDINECMFVAASAGPYVVFDFGRSRHVKKVFVRTQPSGFHPDKFHGIEIRLGNILSSDPFHDYPMFATHFQSTTRNQNIILESTETMEGRYLTFKQTVGTQMQFCFLEVY